MYDVSYLCFFFFKQKTAYEMRISDWSSDVCSSDLFEQNPSVSKNPASHPAFQDESSPGLNASEIRRRLAFALHSILSIAFLSAPLLNGLIAASTPIAIRKAVTL